MIIQTVVFFFLFCFIGVKAFVRPDECQMSDVVLLLALIGMIQLDWWCDIETDKILKALK